MVYEVAGFLVGTALSGFVIFPLTSRIACKLILKFTPEYWSTVITYWLALLISFLLGFPIGFYYGFVGEPMPTSINGLFLLIWLVTTSYYAGKIFRHPDNTQIGTTNGVKVVLTSYLLTLAGVAALFFLALLFINAVT